MKILPKTKWVAGLAAAMLGIVMLPSTGASALEATWGPERPTFTWEVPATYRTFNSITNNPSLGDERNFVRVREVGTNAKYVDELNAEGGKYYEVYVYFHNNAGANLNESGKGIANNVRLSMAIPANVEKGKAATIKGTISATNTEPLSVWDTAFLTAKDSNIHLAYVKNSAVIHSGGSIDGKGLDPTSLLSDAGAKLGYSAENWGIVPGCNEYAGYVTFELYATAQDNPGEDTPVVPEDTPEDNTPGEIPDTGPGEIILASVVGVAVIGGVAYYLYTRKTLHKTMAGVKKAKKTTPKRRK